MKNEVKLSQCSSIAQAVVLAQLTRNQYAIDYWMAALSTLKEMPMYRHKIKQMYGNIQRDVDIYNSHVRGMIRMDDGDDIDGYDIMLDNTAEFHEELKKQIYFYEQGVSRIIQKHRVPHAAWLCKLSTAKDILDIVAFVNGIEIQKIRQIENIGKVPGLQREMPFMMNDEFKSSPSVMGYFTRMCGKMNLEILKALGVKSDIEYSPVSDPESYRTSEIVTKNVLNALMDYKTFMVMYEGEGGKTFKEAREIRNERMREAEEEDARKKAKEQHRDELKKAKREYGSTSMVG